MKYNYIQFNNNVIGGLLMSNYKYNDLTKDGYTKIKLTKEEHIKIFKRYSKHSKYEHYEGKFSIVCRSFDKWYVKVLNIAAYPWLLLIHGLGSFKELNSDMYSLLYQKKIGSFVEDIRYKQDLMDYKSHLTIK